MSAEDTTEDTPTQDNPVQTPLSGPPEPILSDNGEIKSFTSPKTVIP